STWSSSWTPTRRTATMPATLLASAPPIAAAAALTSATRRTNRRRTGSAIDAVPLTTDGPNGRTPELASDAGDDDVEARAAPFADLVPDQVEDGVARDHASPP